MSSIKQVNLFALRTLYKDWVTQKEQLKSPYFDFDDPEVKEALERLLNVLSRKIKVNREQFEPILAIAVAETMSLVFSPYDFYYGQMLPESQSSVSVTDLEQEIRYIHINQNLLNKAIAILKEGSEGEISREDLEKVFDRVLEETDEVPEDFNAFLADFSQVEPLSLDQIYTESSAIEPTPAESTLGSGSDDPNLNQQFTSSQETINDGLGEEQSNTVAELHQAKKIDNVLENISVNQRYMFVNDLFSGDTNQFTEAFEKLEGYQNFEDAIAALHDSYAGANNWDLESDSYKELLGLLEKRYN